jgi:hypothetical protein
VELKKGICGICPAGCWVQVGVEGGNLVSIEADEGHPLGMICKRGMHAPEIVHSPDRLQYPMRRVGPKGTYEFERVSWDQAYEDIVAGLEKIRDELGPEAVSIYTGRGAFELSLCDIYQPKEAAVSSASSILFPFGSPNTMGVGALCYVSFAMIAPHVTMGRMLVNMFTDIENADLLVVWGANPATDSPPLDMYRLEAAHRRGAEVVLVAGVTSLPTPFGVRRIDVGTALEMRDAVLAEFDAASIVIKAAAVSDFRPAEPVAQKIKKESLAEDGRLTLEFVQNPDILREISARKGDRTIVGFAAESHDVVAAAKRKLLRKGCDLIVANDISRVDAGFEVDENAVIFVWPSGEIESLSLLPKSGVSAELFDRIEKLREGR